jgi:hypothetical protein
MEARKLLEGASYGPEMLKIMGQAFDQAWEDIAPTFGNDAADREKGRLRLASAILAVTKDGNQDAELLKVEALQYMALNYRTGGLTTDQG